MDYKQIRIDTKAAFAEAGERDADLSYLTEEYIDDVVGKARSVEELLLLDPGLEGELDQEEVAAVTNYLGNPVFIGWNAYGYIASSNGSCNRNWQLRTSYRRKSIVRKCSSAPYWWIWKVSD